MIIMCIIINNLGKNSCTWNYAPFIVYMHIRLYMYMYVHVWGYSWGYSDRGYFGTTYKGVEGWKMHCLKWLRSTVLYFLLRSSYHDDVTGANSLNMGYPKHWYLT